jgi:thiol-disulfide isomerase/thioredoxin
MRYSFIFIILCELIGLRCNHNSSRNDKFIIIQGNIKNIPDGKVYLTESHRWNVFLDSTKCHNGHFIFKIPNDSAYIPYMASIYFFDSSLFKLQPLIFLNYILSPVDTPKYFNDGFYLGKNFIRLEGDMKAKQKVRVFGSRETDVMYKFNGDFGYLGKDADSLARIKYIANYENTIKKYPYSYFLLQGITSNKEQYPDEEMKKILSLFEKELQQSSLGNKIKSYIQLSSNATVEYKNLYLLNSKDENIKVIDTNARMNMLVMWASWCGPCRMEIPQIKLIYDKFKTKGLKITSISIDEDSLQWKEALNKEKMSWEQLLVIKSKTITVEEIKSIFRFSSIPTVVFIDDKGNLIEKFTDGYNPNNLEKYNNLISKYITN